MPLMIADKGHTFPLALLESAAKFAPTQWGVAVLMKGELKSVRESTTLDVKELNGFQTQPQYKGENFLFVMSKSDKPISEGEQQPFDVLAIETGPDKKLKPAIVACISGEFPTYKADGNTHANVAKEFLSTKLTRMYEKNGKDMAKLMKALEDEEFRELVESVCRPDGTIALLASNGQCIFYNANPKAVKAPFGFTTDLFGLKEEALLPKTKASGLSALGDEQPDKVEAPQPKPDKVVEAAPAEAPKEGEDKKTIVDANAQLKGGVTTLWVKPKKDSGSKAIDNWYYKVFSHKGLKIDNRVELVKNRPAMEVTAEFFKTIHQSSEVVSPPYPKDKLLPYQPFGPPDSTAIGDKLKEAQSVVETMPRASEGTLKFLKEQLKLQPGAADEVLQGLEKKYPSYFQLGHAWDEVKTWPFANYLELAKDPTAIALLAWTLSSKVRNIEPRLAASIRETLEQKPADKQKLAM